MVELSYSINVGKNRPDPTFNTTPLTTWNIIEPNASIICACLTTLKPLVVRLWPKLQASSPTVARDSTAAKKQGVYYNRPLTIGTRPTRPLARRDSDGYSAVMLVSEAKSPDLESEAEFPIYSNVSYTDVRWSQRRPALTHPHGQQQGQQQIYAEDDIEAASPRDVPRPSSSIYDGRTWEIRASSVFDDRRSPELAAPQMARVRSPLGEGGPNSPHAPYALQGCNMF